MRVSALLTAIASLLAVHNVSSRYVFNLGVDKALPPYVGKVNPRRQAPSRASLSVGVVLLVLLTAFGAPFAFGGTDPSVLIGAGSGVGSAGVLLLMAVVSLAAIVWFRRVGVPKWENAWKVFIAPAIAFLALAGMVAFGLARFDLLVGGAPGQYSWLIGVLVGIFIIGCVVALVLKRNRPEVYARLGRRDRIVPEVPEDEKV